MRLSPPPLTERCSSSPAASVTIRLSESRYQALQRLCSVDVAGTVRLTGRLPTHYLKQIALAIAVEAAGGAPVVLEIVVDGAGRESESCRGVGRPQPASP
jgi:hypothetical protein